MDTIPDSALKTIIDTNGREMYRHEFVQMARELRDLRDRFNKREDVVDGGDFRERIRNMKMGDVVKIPFATKTVGHPFEWVALQRIL